MTPTDQKLIAAVESCLKIDFMIRGREVKGQPYSSLCAHLRQGQGWKSLGSDFQSFLEDNGFKVEEGQAVRPGQRSSRQVVYKKFDNAP